MATLSERFHHAGETASCVAYACILLSPLISGLICILFFPLTIFYLIWMFFDRNTPIRGGRPFNCFLSMFQRIARYFPIKLHKTKDLDPSQNYLFCFHPHGNWVYGGIINFLTEATGFGKLFPGLKMRFAIIPCHFRIPLNRDLIMGLGFISPSADSIEYALTKAGPGRSVALVVGGVPETRMVFMKKYQLYILNRKGFIRLAIRTQSPVVPVFSFGETKLFRPAVQAGSCSWRCFRRLGLIPPDPADEMPSFPGFVPLRQEINTVVGEPILFDPMPENISDEEKSNYVDSCHQVYLTALRKLYDDHKEKFGDAETPLIFT